MSDEKKLYRTVITYEILSEESCDWDSLGDVAYAVKYGDCSGMRLDQTTEEVSRERMAELLEAQGSDPAFLLREDE